MDIGYIWVLSWFAPRYWASWLLENPLEDLQKISYLDASWTGVGLEYSGDTWCHPPIPVLVVMNRSPYGYNTAIVLVSEWKDESCFAGSGYSFTAEIHR